VAITVRAWMLTVAVAVFFVALMASAAISFSSAESQYRSVLVVDLRAGTVDDQVAQLRRQNAPFSTMLVLLPIDTDLRALCPHGPAQGEGAPPGQEPPHRGRAPDAGGGREPSVTFYCSWLERDPRAVAFLSNSDPKAIAKGLWGSDVDLTGGQYVYAASLHTSDTFNFGSTLGLALLLSTAVGITGFVFLRRHMHYPASASATRRAGAGEQVPSQSTEHQNSEIRKPDTAPDSFNNTLSEQQRHGMSVPSSTSYSKVSPPPPRPLASQSVGTNRIGTTEPTTNSTQERGTATTFVDASGGYVNIDGFVVWAATSPGHPPMEPGDQIVVVTDDSTSGTRLISALGT
jgi:hypothetical protein